MGGQRIFPGSPILEDVNSFSQAIIAQFRDGMDRLNHERELTYEQQQIVDDLPPNSHLVQEYTALNIASQVLWEQALDKQQHHNLGGDGGFYTTEQLGQRLNVAANRWQRFKRELNEQA